MPSIDTNILLRLILLDNPKQVAQIQALLAQYEDVSLPDQAIIEAVYILGGLEGLSRHDITRILRTVLDNQRLHTNAAVFYRVLEHYQELPAVSFTDMYLEATAYFSGQIPLFTFDKKLARQLPETELVA